MQKVQICQIIEIRSLKIIILKKLMKSFERQAQEGLPKKNQTEVNKSSLFGNDSEERSS